MTTATRTRPTKTREEELLEQLEHHRGQVATLERQASEADHAAAELDARAEARVADLNGSLTELPKSIEDDRNQAQRKRQTAIDLRARAQAYVTQVGLAAITAEHDQLREERIAQGQLEAAIKEAKALVAEAEIRAAWLFRSHITTEAVRARYIECAERLTALQGQHRLAIDVGRFTRLGTEALTLASQYAQMITRDRDPDFWRRNLPELEPLELPAELLAPGAIANPATSQRTAKPFDPTLPKDHALRMAAGAVPAPRNPDGTLPGSVVNPFGGNANSGVPPPRTDAEDRARRKEIAATFEEGG